MKYRYTFAIPENYVYHMNCFFRIYFDDMTAQKTIDSSDWVDSFNNKYSCVSVVIEDTFDDIKTNSLQLGVVGGDLESALSVLSLFQFGIIASTETISIVKSNNVDEALDILSITRNEI